MAHGDPAAHHPSSGHFSKYRLQGIKKPKPKDRYCVTPDP